MRTALTIGVTKDGKHEVIHGPSVPLATQLRNFHEKDHSESFEKVQLWESGSRRMRERKATKGKGEVNFNAAHPVDNQDEKKLPDLTPSFGSKGGVDFNAAHPVEKQQKKGLSDLNKAFRDKSGQGVNFDSARRTEDGSLDTSAATAEEEDLDDLTIADLILFSEKEGVDLTGVKVKADYLQRVREFRKLNESTVPELEQIATSEQAEVTADMLKADLINAIIANRL